MARLCDDGSLTAKHAYITVTTVTIWNEKQHYEIRCIKILYKVQREQNQ
jgi:hypothetical protein